jgi:hypothetical protein
MYDVIWETSAMTELAGLWVDADSAQRSAITGVTADFDNYLSYDPAGHSESRDLDNRIIIQWPLAAFFRIDEAQHIVRVLHVWTFRGHS